MKIIFAIITLFWSIILNAQFTKSDIKITAKDGRNIIALYKGCKNDLKFNINNFSDYNNLKIEFKGGDFGRDSTDMTLFWLAPDIPFPGLYFIYNKDTIIFDEFRVRRIPKPQIYLNKNDTLIQIEKELNKNNLKSVLFNLSTSMYDFSKDCPDDNKWKSEYQLIFYNNEKVVFKYLVFIDEVFTLPKRIYKKCTHFIIYPINTYRITYKEGKQQFKLKSVKVKLTN